MGAKISGAGTSRIEIVGVKKLGGTCYKPISDRIEMGTYLLAGAIAGGEIEICNANMQNIELLAHKISNISCKITYNSDIINIKYKQKGFAFNLETGPFPKFSTDLQPQTLAYLTVCRGQSVVKETLFENRFSQVSDLIKMGADVKIEGNVAYINGVPSLHGCVVRAKDLRGGASLVLAGLCAEGVTIIEDVEHIERGYLNMPEKLSSLGAKINVIT
jgi:UDP-N-acetylglucosamine 1-carboxyvinyltransferase